jgi:hypothetical protein
MPFEEDSREPGGGRSQTSGSRDRKLGDEWADWDGSVDGDIDEPKGRFLLLATSIWGLLAVGLLVLAYLVEPRLKQWPPWVQVLTKGAISVLFVAALAYYLLVLVEVLTERVSVLPYGASEKMLLWLLPKAVWLGGKFGLSRDRIGNSFVKVNNALTRSYRRRIDGTKPVILLPRCLSRETRKAIREMVGDSPYGIYTVGGGEEARKVISKERPSFIIALACERDLISGIRDVALRIPVIGIPNKRPEGPCKNTLIDLEEFRKALQFARETAYRGTPSIREAITRTSDDAP